MSIVNKLDQAETLHTLPSIPRHDTVEVRPQQKKGSTTPLPLSRPEENPPFLEISSTLQPEKKIYYLHKQITNIGRHAANDVVIDECIISNFHAQIRREGEQLVLVHPHPERTQTLNGLRYQDRQVQGNEVFHKALEAGDCFNIGDEAVLCVTITYNSGNQRAQQIPTKIHPLPRECHEITIGRHTNNNIVLNHPLVSDYHAQLIREGESFRVLNPTSTAHISINNIQCMHHLLQTGDEIRIGPYRLIYSRRQLAQYDESNSIRIDALHLKKISSNQKILLNDISLAIPAHAFVAVVGSSGTGKSTLMDALNGLRPAQKGQVLYNGQDCYRHHAIFSKHLGYVPQDDIVHRDLTVERALYYSAKMRLPSNLTHAQIKQRISEVLEDVDMKDQRRQMINKLSGGQRKRVSIALELLDKPSIFFLDEPTSGLDPGLDRRMMLLLRKLANKGHTIILVTHATSNISVCDYVCFMADGGRLAYFGPPVEARTYFGKNDFAEIYGLLETSAEHPHAPEEAEERFRNSADYQKYIGDPLNEKRAEHTPFSSEQWTTKKLGRCNSWQQFLLLSLRYLELLKNDTGSLLILLLQAPIIAILIVLLMKYEIGTGTFSAPNITRCPTTQSILSPAGLPDIHGPGNPVVSNSCERVKIFLQQDPSGMSYSSKRGGEQAALQDFIDLGSGSSAQKVLFIMGFTAVLFGCVNAAREIVKESPIYRRERAVNLEIFPYMFSKIGVLALLCLLQSAILVVIVNAADPFGQGIVLPAIIEVYITMALTSLAGLIIGLAISAIAPSTDRAMSFIPIILIPQVIFSGTIFPFKDWFTQILAMFFAARWSIGALGSTIGLHSDKLGNDKLIGNVFIYHGTLFSVYNFPEAMQYLLAMWLALGTMIFILIGVIALFLKLKDLRA